MQQEQQQRRPAEEPSPPAAPEEEEVDPEQQENDRRVMLLNLMHQCSGCFECDEGICWRLDARRLVEGLTRVHGSSAGVPVKPISTSFFPVFGAPLIAVLFGAAAACLQMAWQVRVAFLVIAVVFMVISVIMKSREKRSQEEQQEEQRRMAAESGFMSPTAWQMLPLMQCLIDVAKEGMSPMQLAMDAAQKYKRTYLYEECLREARKAVNERRIEDAIMWLVFCEEVPEAQRLARKHGMYDLAMVMVQNPEFVLDFMKRQIAMWHHDRSEESHQSLASALSLLAGEGADAQMLKQLRSWLGSFENEEKRVALAAATAFAVAEWDNGRSRRRRLPTLDELLDAALGVLRNRDGLFVEPVELIPGDEFILLRILEHGGAEDDVGQLTGLVGCATEWMLVQCLVAVCPQAFERSAVRNAMKQLADVSSWSLQVFLNLSAFGPGLREALDERAAMDLFIKNRKDNSDMETKVCQEVLLVPKDRWLKIDEASRMKGDWDAVLLMKNASAYIRMAERLDKFVHNMVYKKSDIELLDNVLSLLHSRRDALQGGWTAKLDAIYSYARLVQHPECMNSNPDSLVALAQSIGTWKAHSKGERQTEWRARVHISVFAAQQLKLRSLLNPDFAPQVTADLLSLLQLDPDMQNEFSHPSAAPAKPPRP